MRANSDGTERVNILHITRARQERVEEEERWPDIDA